MAARLSSLRSTAFCGKVSSSACDSWSSTVYTNSRLSARRHTSHQPCRISEPGRAVNASSKAGPPKVVLGESELSKQLVASLPELLEVYRPTAGLKNRHVGTIFPAFFRSKPDVLFRRECLRMQDGSTVAVDWPIDGADKEVWRTEPREDAPILVLLPGLTGGSDDSYVRHMLIRAHANGWRAVVFNSRGCADSPVTTPQFYSASFTEDTRQVVKHIASLYPAARMYAAGWSLGANILVRYLGQEKELTPLSGAVSLCNPFDLVKADEDFHRGFNKVYNGSLAKQLRKIFKKHAHLFKDVGGEFNIQLAANAKTVRQFDDALTRVSFGYKSVDDYYSDASSSRSIEDVQIPLLCIQAEDDPIAPARGIPYTDIKANRHCILVVTPYGGHLGWCAGPDAPFGAPWTDAIVMKYLMKLDAALLDRPAFEAAGREAGEVELVGAYDRKAGPGTPPPGAPS
eukprot:SM000183S03981  [mRNA]  locus=s183:226330:229488:+ [translate_table: standard]